MPTMQSMMQNQQKSRTSKLSLVASFAGRPCASNCMHESHSCCSTSPSTPRSSDIEPPPCPSYNTVEEPEEDGTNWHEVGSGSDYDCRQEDSSSAGETVTLLVKNGFFDDVVDGLDVAWSSKRRSRSLPAKLTGQSSEPHTQTFNICISREAQGTGSAATTNPGPQPNGQEAAELDVKTCYCCWSEFVRPYPAGFQHGKKELVCQKCDKEMTGNNGQVEKKRVIKPTGVYVFQPNDHSSNPLFEFLCGSFYVEKFPVVGDFIQKVQEDLKKRGYEVPKSQIRLVYNFTMLQPHEKFEDYPVVEETIYSSFNKGILFVELHIADEMNQQKINAMVPDKRNQMVQVTCGRVRCGLFECLHAFLGNCNYQNCRSCHCRYPQVGTGKPKPKTNTRKKKGKGKRSQESPGCDC